MNKIPVGKTIASAYSFTFGHIGTIIGLIWLPLLIFFVGEFFIMNYYVQGLDAYVSENDPAALGRPLLALTGFFFLSLFFISVMGVAITRQAMGLRTGGALVHFGLGAAEFNLFVSFLAALLVVMAVYIGIVLGGIIVGIIGAFAVKALTPAMGNTAVLGGAVVLGIAAFVIVFGLLLYVMARLTFLIAPVTVAEGKIDLIRAWSLARGNFWRIFAIGLATLLPITLILLGAEVAILGPGYFIPKGPAVTDAAAQMRQMAAQMRIFSANMPLLLGLGFLLAPFNYGLLFSAPAFAYRALVSVPPATAPDTGPLRPA